MHDELRRQCRIAAGREPEPTAAIIPGESTASRPPTAFQDYLDQHGIQRLRSWRAVS